MSQDAIIKTEHLHPFTLAFDKALREGTIPLDIAEIFVDRVFDAWIEARFREKRFKNVPPVTHVRENADGA